MNITLNLISMLSDCRVKIEISEIQNIKETLLVHTYFRFI